MRGGRKALVVFSLGLCFITGGIFLRLWGGTQTGDIQEVFTHSGLFAVLIGLNIMIVVCIIAYYDKYPRE